MRKFGIKAIFLVLFVLVIAITALLIGYDIYHISSIGSSAAQGSTEALKHISSIKVEIAILLLFMLSLLGLYYYINKYILKPLLLVKEGVFAIKSGNAGQKLDIAYRNEIADIADAINEMAVSLEQSNVKLERQTAELYDRNWELEEANSELEASYGQLQATIEQLNDAEQKYHALVKNIPEIVCVIEETGLISFVNHVCTDILGYEKSELIGKNIFHIINMPKARRLTIKTIIERLKDKSSIMVELPFVKKDGSTIITEANLTNYVVNGYSMGIQAIVRDVTEKRKMEEEIVETNRELAILNAVSKSLTSILDLEELCSMMVNQVTEALKFPAGVLRLVDKSGGHLEPKAFSGSYFKGVKNACELGNIDIKDCFISKAIENNEVFRITESPEGWIWNEVNKDKPEKSRIKDVLVVPITVKNKKFGALSVGAVRTIRPSEVNLISSIANNAAIAMDNALMYETSKKYFIRTIDALIATVEAKDSYTEGHSQRVSKYAVMIAGKLGLSREQIEDIKVAGILHDIGKIGISDNILLKSSKLTEEEYREVKQHPAISNKILYPVGFSERTLKAIAFHHERVDGKGYPFGLSGEDITIEAQIIAVADAFDAMTSNRSYRMAMSREEAIEELRANKATQFNPAVVDAFIEMNCSLSDA